MHKIGRKNLHLHGDSRVCSERFVHSTRRRLQIDEYLTTKLPKLPTMVNPPLNRRFPRKRVCEAPSTILLLDEFVGEADTRRDGTGIGSNTSRTGADTKTLLLRLLP